MLRYGGHGLHSAVVRRGEVYLGSIGLPELGTLEAGKCKGRHMLFFISLSTKGQVNEFQS